MSRLAVVNAGCLSHVQPYEDVASIHIGTSAVKFGVDPPVLLFRAKLDALHLPGSSVKYSIVKTSRLSSAQCLRPSSQAVRMRCVSGGLED